MLSSLINLTLVSTYTYLASGKLLFKQVPLLKSLLSSTFESTAYFKLLESFRTPCLSLVDRIKRAPELPLLPPSLRMSMSSGGAPTLTRVLNGTADPILPS